MVATKPCFRKWKTENNPNKTEELRENGGGVSISKWKKKKASKQIYTGIDKATKGEFLFVLYHAE